MKKNVFLLLSVLLLSAFMIGCSQTKTKGTYDPGKEKVVIESNSSDMEEIAKLLSDKCYSRYKSDDVIWENKLKDYKIEKIKIKDGTIDQFRFDLTYSVKPASDNSDFNAGDGIIQGSWINDKEVSVTVEKVDKGFAIKEFGE